MSSKKPYLIDPLKSGSKYKGFPFFIENSFSNAYVKSEFFKFNIGSTNSSVYSLSFCERVDDSIKN